MGDQLLAFVHAAWAQVKGNWVALLPIVAGVFYLAKLRNEEVLKTRLQFALEAYEAYTDLNEVVRDWVIIPNIPGRDRDAEFRRGLNEVRPRVERAFHHANLVLPPGVGLLLHGLMTDVGALLGQYLNWSERLASGSLSAEEERAGKESWEKARASLAARVNGSHKQLLADLQDVTLGRWGAWRWRRMRRELALKYMAERELNLNDL